MEIRDVRQDAVANRERKEMGRVSAAFISLPLRREEGIFPVSRQNPIQ
jgi:hypothetical protein